MKTVFMGTSDFAVAPLKSLIEAGHDVRLVVTQPDKRGNRGKVTFSPVKEAALEAGITVAQPEKIRNDEEFIKELVLLAPDVTVVAAFGQILPPSVLEIPKYGCINVHGSLLPKLRGASPMQTSILEGDEVTGVTIMRMDEGLDTGDIISEKEVAVDGKDITELAEELSEAGADLLTETLEAIKDGTAVYTKQDDEEATYSHIIKKSGGYTDFSEPAVSIERKIRAFKEWPTVYSFLGDTMVKFFDAEVLNEEPNGEPGTVADINKEGFTVNCSEGKLFIKELQLQGKKRMDAASFLNGRRLTKGERFSE